MEPNSIGNDILRNPDNMRNSTVEPIPETINEVSYGVSKTIGKTKRL